MDKKIVHIISTLDNQGPVNVLYNMLAAGDQDFRDNVSIITLSPELPNSKLDSFKKLGVKIVPLNLSRLKGLIMLVSEIKKELNRIRPDVIHSHCFRSTIVTGYFISKQYNTISTLQNNPFDDYTMNYGKIIGNAMSYLHLGALKRVSKVVVCSDFIKTKIADKLGREINVIFNGVEDNNTDILSAEQKNISKIKFGINPQNKIYIFIANLIPRKDPVSLINAFKLVLENRKDTSLLIIGDGPMLQECRNIAAGFTDIHFIGRVSNIIDYLKLADYFISTSLSEGMPTVVMNSLALGVPPVLSRIPPHEEMMKGRGYKFFFDTGNVEQILLNIELIGKEDYNTLSFQMKLLFQNNYSSSLMFKNYKRLYDTI